MHHSGHNQAPNAAPRGCSPWTLLGCGCGLAAMLGILAVFFLLGMLQLADRRDPAWSRADFTACQNNLKYLRAAVRSFETDHHRLPKTLQELQPRYLDTPERLRCPLAAKEIGAPYQYNPRAAGGDAPLITCANHGQATLVLTHAGLLRLLGKAHKQPRR